jgi:hypothetical protein
MKQLSINPNPRTWGRDEVEAVTGLCAESVAPVEICPPMREGETPTFAKVVGDGILRVWWHYHEMQYLFEFEIKAPEDLPE